MLFPSKATSIANSERGRRKKPARPQNSPSHCGRTIPNPTGSGFLNFLSNQKTLKIQGSPESAGWEVGLKMSGEYLLTKMNFTYKNLF